MKTIKFLAAAGLAAAFGASQASAWSGDIIKCNPTPGRQITVAFSGLSCKETKNKLSLKTSFEEGNSINGCVANVANAPFNAWVAGKWSKVDAAIAGTITQADVKLKGSSFGSCNLSGSDTSAGANASGEIKFLNSAGEKVTSSKFFGTVAGNPPADPLVDPATVEALGLVTKGFGIGGDVTIGAIFDITDPINSPIVACSGGFSCLDPNDPNDPLNLSPAEVLLIETDASNTVLLLSLGEDDPNDPNDYDALP